MGCLWLRWSSRRDCWDGCRDRWDGCRDCWGGCWNRRGRWYPSGEFLDVLEELGVFQSPPERRIGVPRIVYLVGGPNAESCSLCDNFELGRQRGVGIIDVHAVSAQEGAEVPSGAVGDSTPPLNGPFFEFVPERALEVSSCEVGAPVFGEEVDMGVHLGGRGLLDPVDGRDVSPCGGIHGGQELLGNRQGGRLPWR